VYDQSQLLDFLSVTLNDLPEQEFEVGWTNQDYEACRIYQKERVVIDGGAQIERKIMLSNTGMARYRKYFDTDDPIVGNHMKTIKVPWTQIGTQYSWDELEIKHQMNSAKGFIRLLGERRIDGLWSMADLIEERFWMTPMSATDTLYPYGIPYYLNMIDADATGSGFLGKTIRYQGGTTGTVCADIDASEEKNWRNYAFTYTNIDRAFLKAVRLGFMYTRFKAPLFINDPSNVRSLQKRFYSDYNMVASLMDLADSMDDNHTGKDALGKMLVDDGANVLLNRVPVVPIPQIEGAIDPQYGQTTEPLYLVDFSYLVPVVHDGYWMRETEPDNYRGQHTAFTIYLDGAHNNLCKNRRQIGFVGHKALTSS